MIHALKFAILAAITICAVNLGAEPREPSSVPRNHRHLPHPRPVAKAPPPIAPSEAPTIPSPVADLPPVATYHEGALAVTAQNAALGEILEKIQESTGAVIEAPVLMERVTVQLAPQAPVRVIAALLEGMHLNYVIQGGTGSQDCLLHLIVIAKPVPQVAPNPKPEDVLAEARAQLRFTEETGGDEGVWDNRPGAPEQK